jgi:hypothetical protein
MALEAGRTDDAVALVHRYGDSGTVLAPLLEKHGLVDAAIAVLRPLAAANDKRAIGGLLGTMAKHGRWHDLAGEVAAGTPGAADVACGRKPVLF